MSRTGFGQTTVEAEITRTTEKAVLAEIDGREVWAPRKVCLEGDMLDVGDTDIIVADWWLKKEGLA